MTERPWIPNAKQTRAYLDASDPKPLIASQTRRVDSVLLARCVGGAAEVWHGELGRCIADLQASLDAQGLEHAGPAEYLIEVSLPVRPRTPQEDDVWTWCTDECPEDCSTDHQGEE
jgi:hypothetical protein